MSHRKAVDHAFVQVYGTFELVRTADHPDVIAYTRTFEDDRWLFVGNFGRTAAAINVAELVEGSSKSLICSTLSDDGGSEVKPLEARLYRLS